MVRPGLLLPGSADCALFREEADAARCIGRTSLSEEVRSTEVGVPDSLMDDSDAEEFPLMDSVLSVESKEEAEEDEGEEARRVAGGWGEAVPSEERRDGGREEEEVEAAGGDEGEAEEEWALAEGEDGGEW